MKIFLVAGARPNYVKIAALIRAFERFKKRRSKSRLIYKLINTGQHYDYLMSRKFFKDLRIPAPFVDLNVGSSTHAVQTAAIMTAFEKVVLKYRPDLVMVVGDVNSTVACSLVASKLHIPVAHVEAGLRSGDRRMPEELNRLVTDALSDYLFTTCRDGDRNLIREGVGRKKIHFVGNVMVDTLLAHLTKAKRSGIHRKLKLRKPYALVTLHRPSNVDRDEDFRSIVRAIESVQKKRTVLFPVHPRTAVRLKKGVLSKKVTNLSNLRMIDPLGYLDFMAVMAGADLVLTDSGGIQEETTVLGIPCVTLRENTERPVTIVEGTNVLAGKRYAGIMRAVETALRKKKRKRIPALWDGKAADRIVKILAKELKF